MSTTVLIIYNYNNTKKIMAILTKVTKTKLVLTWKIWFIDLEKSERYWCGVEPGSQNQKSPVFTTTPRNLGLITWTLKYNFLNSTVIACSKQRDQLHARGSRNVYIQLIFDFYINRTKVNMNIYDSNVEEISN